MGFTHTFDWGSNHAFKTPDGRITTILGGGKVEREIENVGDREGGKG